MCFRNFCKKYLDKVISSSLLNEDEVVKELGTWERNKFNWQGSCKIAFSCLLLRNNIDAV